MTLVAFESRNNMVGRFAVKALLWWVPRGKMAARLTTRGVRRNKDSVYLKG